MRSMLFMVHRKSHSIEIGRAAALGLALACAITGCWQEIEYTGPDPVAAAGAPAAPPADPHRPAVETPPNTPLAVDRSATDAQRAASGFADDLAASLADGASAETIAAAVESALSAPSPNTRRTAWLLGSNLSLAALANDRAAAVEKVAHWLADSRSQAESLGTSVAELPERTADGGSPTASRQVLNYLFLQGQRIGRDLAKAHGPDHAALFEVAVKSNILLTLYQPGAPAADALSAAIAQAAPRAQLPADLWQPLLDALTAKAPPADVRQAVQRFHADVDQYLAGAAEQ